MPIDCHEDDFMTCRELAPDIVDHARGVPIDPLRHDAVTRHLQSCQACSALVDRERAMSAALRHLSDRQTVPPASDLQLRKLLASFDVPRARRRRVRVAFEWSLAASVLIVAGLAVGWKSEALKPVSEKAAATAESPVNADSAFTVLPGADALPRFEHGQVIQVDIPSAGGVVRAEVLIGQDGLARAARLVQ